jgi:hypothetical protein
MRLGSHGGDCRWTRPIRLGKCAGLAGKAALGSDVPHVPGDGLGHVGRHFDAVDLFRVRTGLGKHFLGRLAFDEASQSNPASRHLSCFTAASLGSSWAHHGLDVETAPGLTCGHSPWRMRRSRMFRPATGSGGRSLRPQHDPRGRECWPVRVRDEFSVDPHAPCSQMLLNALLRKPRGHEPVEHCRDVGALVGHRVKSCIGRLTARGGLARHPRHRSVPRA